MRRGLLIVTEFLIICLISSCGDCYLLREEHIISNQLNKRSATERISTDTWTQVIQKNNINLHPI